MPSSCRLALVCCSASSSSGGGSGERPSISVARRALARRALSLRQQQSHAREEASDEDSAAPSPPPGRKRQRAWGARRFSSLLDKSSSVDTPAEEQQQESSTSSSQLLDAQRQLLKRIFESKPDSAWLDAPLGVVEEDVAPDCPAQAAAEAQQQCLQLEELPAEKHTEEECSVEHPGTVCCTRTTVTRDAAAMNVLLHVTTSVRCARAR